MTTTDTAIESDYGSYDDTYLATEYQTSVGAVWLEPSEIPAVTIDCRATPTLTRVEADVLIAAIESAFADHPATNGTLP